MCVCERERGRYKKVSFYVLHHFSNIIYDFIVYSLLFIYMCNKGNNMLKLYDTDS